MKSNVFITGGTGFIGTRLIARLIENGHNVCALVRRGSENKLPAGCTPLFGNALDASTFSHLISPADTFVHLVGVAHPGPAKAGQFKTIDLVSIQASVPAAKEANIQHFIYLSVAHPAPAMHAYVEVRKQGEALIRDSGMNATILRPWYVLGPGHWWPLLFKPIYWIAEQIPATREDAQRLGLVTIHQIVEALIHIIENPPRGEKIFGVVEIRSVKLPQFSTTS